MCCGSHNEADKLREFCTTAHARRAQSGPQLGRVRFPCLSRFSCLGASKVHFTQAYVSMPIQCLPTHRGLVSVPKYLLSTHQRLCLDFAIKKRVWRQTHEPAVNIRRQPQLAICCCCLPSNSSPRSSQGISSEKSYSLCKTLAVLFFSHLVRAPSTSISTSPRRFCASFTPSPLKSGTLVPRAPFVEALRFTCFTDPEEYRQHLLLFLFLFRPCIVTQK